MITPFFIGIDSFSRQSSLAYKPGAMRESEVDKDLGLPFGSSDIAPFNNKTTANSPLGENDHNHISGTLVSFSRCYIPCANPDRIETVFLVHVLQGSFAESLRYAR
jgi:hypothetical protein